MIDKNDKIYIMEFGPRTGGDYVPEVIEMATGFRFSEAVIESSIGVNKFSKEFRFHRKLNHYCYYVLHSNQSGIFKDICLPEFIMGNVITQFLSIKKGEIVNKFCGSNTGIGHLILKFDTRDEMEEKITLLEEYIEVIFA